MVEYIEREKAMVSIRDQYDDQPIDDMSVGWNAGLSCAIGQIESIPASIVIERKKGEWIDRDDIYNMWGCSVCGEEFVLVEGTPNSNEYNYCPFCGADMRCETK